MAKYLLIEVDSNATAAKLRAQIEGAGEAKGMRVVGQFSKATMLCECNPSTYPRTIGNAPIQTRGAKKGWMICPNCAKPRDGGSQTLWNELDPEGAPTRRRELWIGVRWLKDAAGRVITARTN